MSGPRRVAIAVLVALWAVTSFAACPDFLRQDYAVVGLPQVIAVGDFNGDGRPDLAVATDALGLGILLGTGGGAFTFPAHYPTGTNQNSVATGDFNGDGRIDVAVAASTSQHVSVFIGRGDGTMAPAVNLRRWLYSSLGGRARFQQRW